MGRKGEVLFYQYAIQFFEKRIDTMEFYNICRRLAEKGYVDEHLCNLISPLTQNITPLVQQNHALLNEITPSKRRLFVLRMLGYREGEADPMLKTSRLFHGSGQTNSLKELIIDAQSIMLAAFLEGQCFYFRGGIICPPFEPSWFHYCEYISYEQMKKEDSFAYGKYKYCEEDVGITIERAKNHNQISLTIDKMVSVEASNLYDFLVSTAQKLRLNGDSIYTVASPFLMDKSARIHRLTIVNKWTDREKVFLYSRIFSARTEEVIINNNIIKHPFQRTRLVLDALNEMIIDK